ERAPHRAPTCAGRRLHMTDDVPLAPPSAGTLAPRSVLPDVTKLSVSLASEHVDDLSLDVHHRRRRRGHGPRSRSSASRPAASLAASFSEYASHASTSSSNGTWMRNHAGAAW